DPVTDEPTHDWPAPTALLYGFSPAVVECPSYWPSSIKVCGFWFPPPLQSLPLDVSLAVTSAAKTEAEAEAAAAATEVAAEAAPEAAAAVAAAAAAAVAATAPATEVAKEVAAEAAAAQGGEKTETQYLLKSHIALDRSEELLLLQFLHPPHASDSRHRQSDVFYVGFSSMG
ncbi:unnamed protein product, partial [Closterium sp. NIES-54]